VVILELIHAQGPKRVAGPPVGATRQALVGRRSGMYLLGKKPVGTQKTIAGDS